MKDPEILKAVHEGRNIIKGEFRAGTAGNIPWSKNGKSGIIKSANFHIEMAEKPLVLRMQLPDNSRPEDYKFPPKGSKCIFELAIRQGDKGATYLDIVSVTPLAAA